MRRFLTLAPLVFSVLGLTVRAQLDAREPVEAPTKSPALAVEIVASFPSAEIFGIKLVNGKPTQAVLSVSNDEAEAITVNFAGGSLWTPDFDPQGSRIVRNLTAVRYGLEVGPGEKESFPYTFATEMHPQELRLNIAAVISDSQGTFYTVQAFNGSVAVVEQDTSIFDPQIIFLYIFILACGAATLYFFYNIWVAPYFPQKKGRTGERAKRSAAGSKKVDAPDAVPVAGPDGQAVTTGAKAYDEDWLPAHHLQRPEARRVKSGTPRPKSKGKAE